MWGQCVCLLSRWCLGFRLGSPFLGSLISHGQLWICLTGVVLCDGGVCEVQCCWQQNASGTCGRCAIYWDKIQGWFKITGQCWVICVDLCMTWWCSNWVFSIISIKVNHVEEPGVVLLWPAQRQGPVYKHCYGRAMPATWVESPNLLDFNVASFSDLFTAQQITQTSGFGPSKNGGGQGHVSPHFSGPFPGSKKKGFWGDPLPKRPTEAT